MFLSVGHEIQLHSVNASLDYEITTAQNSPSHSTIMDASICSDNSYLAVLRENEKPQIVSTKDKSNMRLIHNIHISGASAIVFRKTTKRYIAVGTKTGDVLLYDTKNREVQETHRKVSYRPVKRLDYTCDDNFLCGIGDDVFFYLNETSTERNFVKLRQTSECISLKCHWCIPNRVAVGFKNGRVSIWDVFSRLEMLNVEIFNNIPVSDMAMSSCGNYLAASGDEVLICSLDFGENFCIHQRSIKQEYNIVCIDLSFDDRMLVFGSTDGSVKLYYLSNLSKPAYSIVSHDATVNKVLFLNSSRQPTSNFSSTIQCSVEDGVKSPRETLSQSPAVTVIKNKALAVPDSTDRSIRAMREQLLRVVKEEMDLLETQLQGHCSKFQKFLDHEFQVINNTIASKWDIFTDGDMTKILKAICPDVKSDDNE